MMRIEKKRMMMRRIEKKKLTMNKIQNNIIVKRYERVDGVCQKS